MKAIIELLCIEYFTVNPPTTLNIVINCFRCSFCLFPIRLFFGGGGGSVVHLSELLLIFFSLLKHFVDCHDDSY